MSETPVLAAVAGRAIALQDVIDLVFAQGTVGHGAVIDSGASLFAAVK